MSPSFKLLLFFNKVITVIPTQSKLLITEDDMYYLISEDGLNYLVSEN